MNFIVKICQIIKLIYYNATKLLFSFINSILYAYNNKQIYYLISNQISMKQMQAQNNQDEYATIMEKKDKLGPLSSITSSQVMDELYRMKQYFNNSLKINEKLHAQIITKEYMIKNQSADFKTTIHQVSRQIKQSHNKTKQIYEQTTRQNQKIRQIAQEFIRPFRQQLKHKVDEWTLSLKMKMMLNQFDSNYDKSKNVEEGTGNSAFNFIKKEILPYISQLQTKINQQKQTNKSRSQDIQSINNKQNRIQRQIKKSNALVEELKLKISQKIGQKQVNIGEYIKKAAKTQQNIIKNIQSIKNNQAKYDQQLSYIKNQTKSLQILKNNQNRNHQQMFSLKNEVKNLSQRTKTYQEVISKKLDEQNRKIIDTVTIKVNQVQQDLMKFKIEKKKETASLEDQINAMKHQNKQFLGKIQQQISKNYQNIQNLKNQIQIQNKNSLPDIITKKMEKINKQLQEIKIKIRGFQYQSMNMQDLLSKKANFSDLIFHLQGKTNKQDYKQLKNLIQANQLIQMNPYITSSQEKRRYSNDKFYLRKSHKKDFAKFNSTFSPHSLQNTDKEPINRQNGYNINKYLNSLEMPRYCKRYKMPNEHVKDFTIDNTANIQKRKYIQSNQRSKYEEFRY